MTPEPPIEKQMDVNLIPTVAYYNALARARRDGAAWRMKDLEFVHYAFRCHERWRRDRARLLLWGGRW